MPTNIIDSIQLSGTVYTIQGSGGGNPTVELTQAEYDALVSAGTVSADTYYIISDATAFDPTTKVDTSAITSSVTSASTDSQIPTAKAVWEAASGGGTTYTAGRGIDITNDTISVSLPISAGTGDNSIAEGENTQAVGYNSHAEGGYTRAIGESSHAEGWDTIASGDSSHAEGNGTTASSYSSHAEGMYTRASGYYSHAEGIYTIANNASEHASGQFNVSSSASTTWGDSGNTLFSVGNGTRNNARHNAFEIRQNGDIYLSLNGQDVKLQDHLGGGGASYSAGTGIDITNNVISVSGVVETSAITSSVTSSSTDSEIPTAKAVWEAATGGGTIDQSVISGSTNAVSGGAVYTQLGGLKLQKITQSAYDALATKDANTLYVING